MNANERFNILRSATDLAFPKWGAWLYDTWASHNETYFEGRLSVVPLYFGLVAREHRFGAYHSDDGYPRITLHQSLLDSVGNDWELLPLGGQRFAADVLLHEMLHQAIYEKYGHDSSQDKSFHGASSHNNALWCAEIMRVAPLLGLCNVKAQPIKQLRFVSPVTGKKGNAVWFVQPEHLDRVQLATFPQCLTAPAFYRNETDSRSIYASNG